MKSIPVVGLALLILSSLKAEGPITFYGTPPPHDEPVRRYGDDRFRVSGAVGESALSADGKRLAVLSTSQQRQHAIVTIFDADTGRPLVVSRVQYTGFGVFSRPHVAFSPDGRHVAAVVNGDTTFVLAADTGREVWRTKDAQNGYSFCAFDAAGRLVRTGDKQTRVYELPSGRVAATWPVGGIAALTPDGTTFVKIVREFGEIAIGDTATGKIRLTLPERTATNGYDNGLAISHDGTTLAVVHNYQEIHLLDLATGQTHRSWRLPDKCIDPHDPNYTVSWSADDGTIFLGSRGVLHRWDATGKALLPLRPAIKANWHGVHLAKGGKHVLALSTLGVVERWDATTGGLLPVDANLGKVRFALTPDGERLVTADVFGRILVLDAATGGTVRQLQERKTSSWLANLSLSPDGRQVATISHQGQIDVFPVAAGEERVLALGGAVWALDDLIWAADSASLFAGPTSRGRGIVKRYDIATGRVSQSILANGLCARSPDGQELIVVTVEKQNAEQSLTASISRWNIADGKVVGRLMALDQRSLPRLVAFGPDLSCVAITAGHQIHLPSLGSLTIDATDPAPFDLGAWKFGETARLFVTSLAFTPNGRWLISAGEDGAVKVWEAATGKLLRRFDGHDGLFGQVAVSADGRFAFSSGGDGFVCQWDLTPSGYERLTATAETLWKNAADAEPAVGVPAAWKLMSDESHRAFVAKTLPPVGKPDAEKVAAWIAQLDAPAFADRAAATKELAALERRADAALRAALQKTASAEVRQRIEDLIARFEKKFSPEELRAIRLVQAAEWFKLKEPLAAWATGAESATLTRDAAAALLRLRAVTRP